jgi:hypothetical protein
VATRFAAGRMSIMPKAFPKEFRDDVVRFHVEPTMN